MSDLEITSMDLVRELRLRQWARQNYVPLESRRSTWHPVVLDEMIRRDRELTNEMEPPISDLSLSAPIDQTNVLSETADDELTDDELTDVEAGESFQSNAGSRFVPLAPDTHFRLDESCGDVPKPHAWVRVTHSHYLPAFVSSSSID